MNRPEISAATLLCKLKIALKQDIEVIESLIDQTDDTKFNDLLISLLSFKKSISLELLPYAEGTADIPTTPQKFHPKSYQSWNGGNSQSQVKILQNFYHIDRNQQQFIIRGFQAKGIPKKIEILVNKLVKMYNVLVLQLDRMSKTQQYQSVNIF